jgi:hypothetical protein
VRRWIVGGIVVASLVSGAATSGLAQGSLAEMAERVRQGWRAHDAEAIVGQSDTLVLQIPGADPAAPLDRAHAVELVRGYWRAAVEQDVELRGLREVEPGTGYVELERRYAVAGTSDVRHETIFLRFRKVGSAWRLAGLRSVP